MPGPPIKPDSAGRSSREKNEVEFMSKTEPTMDRDDKEQVTEDIKSQPEARTRVTAEASAYLKVYLDHKMGRQDILRRNDGRFNREIEAALIKGADNPKDTAAELAAMFSLEEFKKSGLSPEKSGLSPEESRRISTYAIRVLVNRTFYDEGGGEDQPFAARGIEEQAALRARQIEKRQAAMKLYEEHFNSVRPSEASTDRGNSRSDRSLQIEVLHDLMEHAIDPDFRDEELAKRIYDLMDIPKERARYGSRERIATLQESRLALFNAPRANCLTPSSGEGCIDKEMLTGFVAGNADSININGIEVSHQSFVEMRNGAEPRIDVSIEGLVGFLREGRYKTIHESPEAQRIWEKANPGYHGRRMQNERSLGINAKGTVGDEHVISAYLHVPGKESLAPQNGQYGNFHIRLKKETLKRSGFTKMDAFRTLNDPEGNRLNLDAAVLYASDPKAKGPFQNDYIEAQVFGGVIADDVEDIDLKDIKSDDREAALIQIVGALDEKGLRDVIDRFPGFRKKLYRFTMGLEFFRELRTKNLAQLMKDFDPNSEYQANRKLELDRELGELHSALSAAEVLSRLMEEICPGDAADVRTEYAKELRN